MQKTCQQCGINYLLSQEELILYKRFKAEPENICFDCQQMHRISFRNERVLYNRKCDATGEDIVSIYAPDKPYKVFSSKHWHSDKWDPFDYGRPFDFNRPFFDQFKELQTEVPRSPLVNLKSENSDYCNMCVGNKNCYLIFGGDFNRDCMYGTLCMHNRDSLDIDYSNKNELCYFMDNSINCYNSRFTWDSKNCNDCAFISDCTGCSNCIFCTNLQNKSYCIENVQYTKEEYAEKKKEILNGSYQTQIKNFKKFLELMSGRIIKYGHIISCENCTGDYLKNSKNCQNCYDVSDSEDITNCIFAAKSKDSFNVSLLGDDTQLTYNSIAVLGSHNIKYSYFVLECSDIEYSEQVISSHNLFGCNGLRHKKYCIFNKQYKKEEYEEMRKKIIEHMKKTGEWGKFFPKDLSCFAYNESTGMRYYPLTKEMALQRGFTWREENQKDYVHQKIEIPDNIKDIPESITDEILVCEGCHKNFKIIPQELKFYKKQEIPVPHKCADCRQKQRSSLRNPPKLYDRTCTKCGTPLKTTYAPDRPEKIYCEKCYLKSIY